jgi:hypothetical protein
MLLSIQFARAFLYENSRLFTAMALFACSWALVLCNYGLLDSKQQMKGAFLEDKEIVQLPVTIKDRIQNLNSASSKLQRAVKDSSGFLIAISSFLFVFVGGLLMLEGRSTNSATRPLKVDELQFLALYLLFCVAAPRALEVPLLHFQINVEEMSVILDGAADIIGFVCLGVGALYIIKQSPLPDGELGSYGSALKKVLFYVLVAILAFYTVLEIVYHKFIWDELQGRSEKIPDLLFYMFAVLKVLLTTVLGFIVVYHGMPREIRVKGFLHWLRLLVPF